MGRISNALLQDFLAYSARHRLVEQGPSLLAVSGGVDSVVLAHLFHVAGWPFAIAHMHFGLRGAASDQDEALVCQLAGKYRVPYHVQRVAAKRYGKAHGVSLQMAARALRYQWFHALLDREGYARLAVAHHHDDQLETVLYRLARGSGLKGLCGMNAGVGRLVRPLLFSRKKDLIAYAKQQQLSWREDRSNQLLRYQRNLVRHRVVPLFRTLNPHMEGTFARTLDRLTQVQSAFEEMAQGFKERVWRDLPSCAHIDLAPLKGKEWAPSLLYHWLQPFGFSFAPLQRWWLARPQAGRRLLSPTHFLLADRGRWIVGKHLDREAERAEQVAALPCTVQLPDGRLTIGAPQPCQGVPRTGVWLDYDRLVFPLTLRRWQAGDLFAPLGMGGRHKKLCDFLTDRKVSCHQKARVYLLISGEGRVAWVVGDRIDDRFKVTSDTSRVVSCAFPLDSGDDVP